MRTDRWLAAFEFALWVLVASVAVVAVTAAIGLVVGGDLVAAKTALFLVGFLLFGVGSVAIQPSGPNLEGSVLSPDGDQSRASPGEGGQSGGRRRSGWSLFGGDSDRHDAGGSVTTGEAYDDRQFDFEARLQTVGPLADRHLPYERRIGRGWKVFVTGLVVLAVSFLMEVAGVQI